MSETELQLAAATRQLEQVEKILHDSGAPPGDVISQLAYMLDLVG